MAPTDRDILLALYRSTDGDNWMRNTNWGTEADLSDWFGVDVDQGRVVKLSLGTNNLLGIVSPALRTSPLALVQSP